MVFKLGLSAEKGWRKLRGFRQLADVINNVKFIDGIDEKKFNNSGLPDYATHTPDLTITRIYHQR